MRLITMQNVWIAMTSSGLCGPTSQNKEVFALMPVKMQPEPPHFFEKVQKKGDKFRLENPHAKGNNLKPYWRKIIPDLHSAYSGICAYTCHWIPYDTGSVTVEHFKPKEVYPQYAYCWDNYRLVCGRFN